MTEHRDHGISRRLAELDTPEHGPDFWVAVRAANSTPQPSGGDAHFVENAEPVTLGDRRRAVARRIWLVAAALVVLALVAVGSLVDRKAGETDVTTEPTPATGPDDGPTAPGGPLRPDGDLIERGPGSVVAVDPTGQFLYVTEQDPTGEPGCEGQPSPVLLVEPVDGGGRREVLPPDVGSVTGAYQVRFGPDGEVAVVTQCEGSGATVVTGTVGDDGTVAEPMELTLPDVDLGQDVDGILDLEFRTAGTLVASTRTVTGDGTEHRHLYEFPVGPGEVNDLGQDDVVQLDATADGRLATASSDGSIRFDGKAVAQLPDVADIAVSPSGTRLNIAMWGAGGIVTIDLTSGVETVLDRTAGSPAGVVVAPADGIVLYALGESASWYVHSVDFESSEPDTTLLVQAQGGTEIVLTPDLSRLFVTGHADEDANGVVLEQRLTR